MDMLSRPLDLIMEDSEIDKNELLKKMKALYKSEVSKSVEETDGNIFFWINNFVTVYFILDINCNVVFATTSQEKDDLKIINLKNQTDNLDFKRLYTAEQKLAYFNKYNLFRLSTEAKIIQSSLNNIPMNIRSFIERWIQREYNKANQQLSLPALKISYVNENELHQSKFQFREMLSNVDDEQFKAEFSEFLFGYNNEKFFLAASALGSIIEHLLFIILNNYGDERLIGTRRPTADKYLKAMERQHHFSFTDRDSIFIDNIFQTRNSISHYNSGYVLKSQCDMMLMGLNSIYRRFYLPSKTYSASHE